MILLWTQDLVPIPDKLISVGCVTRWPLQPSNKETECLSRHAFHHFFPWKAQAMHNERWVAPLLGLFRAILPRLGDDQRPLRHWRRRGTRFQLHSQTLKLNRDTANTTHQSVYHATISPILQIFSGSQIPVDTGPTGQFNECAKKKIISLKALASGSPGWLK